MGVNQREITGKFKLIVKKIQPSRRSLVKPVALVLFQDLLAQILINTLPSSYIRS